MVTFLKCLTDKLFGFEYSPDHLDHIAQANEETLQRCRQWGYRLAVGDWGQLDTKKHLDIDELLAAGRQNEVKLITSAAKE